MSPTLVALPPTEGLAEKLRIAIWIGAGSGPGLSVSPLGDSVAEIGCCNCPSAAAVGAAPESISAEQPPLPAIAASTLAMAAALPRTSPRFIPLPFDIAPPH